MTRMIAGDTDRAFDRLLPEHLRLLSYRHWTPVDIAIRAASLLRPTRGTRVLDVGSGVGKLCVVGAMSAAGLWCGVEQDEPLVHTARMLASTLGIAARTRFLHGDALALDWDDYDAIYLYNPFENPLYDVDPRQQLVDFQRQVACVQDRLANLREGVRVVTLEGFGGTMPPSFDLEHHERIGRVGDVGFDLAMWVQRARSNTCKERP